MENLGPTYTDRQRAIIERKIEPETQDEWNYLQDHGNDLLPKVKPEVPAQRLSNGKKLPDVEVPDWTDH